jgi:hypothetical protein
LIPCNEHIEREEKKNTQRIKMRENEGGHNEIEERTEKEEQREQKKSETRGVITDHGLLFLAKSIRA